MEDSPQINNTNEEVEAPVKKKRGRKPKPKPEVTEVKIPKKRGRKPKLKLISQEDKNKFVLPSKRGRKPKDKNVVFNKDLNLDNISNIILHLPIPLDILDKLDEELSFKYNPEINNPNPYDPSEQTDFKMNIDNNNNNNNCIYTVIESETETETEKDEENMSEKLNENDINELQNKKDSDDSKYNKYINNYYNETHIDKNIVKCNWCLHNCNNDVIKLPYSITNDVFNMYGNFCCPECAAAFNFNELDDEYVWERYSLLNYVYNNNSEKYNIAPSRLILDIFGGPLSIEEYRDIIQTKKNINVVYPPMYVLKPQIEISKTEEYIPLNLNRINKYTTDLKLKRSKIKTKTNTLDSCMNLKCSS